jgi:hypothetical protein
MISRCGGQKDRCDQKTTIFMFFLFSINFACHVCKLCKKLKIFVSVLSSDAWLKLRLMKNYQSPSQIFLAKRTLKKLFFKHKPVSGDKRGLSV